MLQRGRARQGRRPRPSRTAWRGHTSFLLQREQGSRRGSDWCRSIPGRTPAQLCRGGRGLGRAPLSRDTGCARANCRKLERSRRQPSRALLASDRAGLVPSAIRRCLSRRERERNGPGTAIGDHTGLGAPTATRAARRFTTISLPNACPFRAGRLVRPDGSAVDNRHVKRDPTLMHQLEPTFLDALLAQWMKALPAPRAKLRGDAAPLGLVLVPSRDCRNGPPQPFGGVLLRGPTSSVGGSHTTQLASMKTSHLLRSIMPQI